jgi:2-dehydropantoate 2-reductase
MRIVVFGVGAIGGFYGTKLAHYINKNNPKDLKLSFIARGETYRVLKSQGTKLFIKKGSFAEMQETILHVNDLDLYQDYSELELNPEELCVVLLCTKSKDTITASEAIKKNFHKNTLVVSIQNGVDNEDKISSVLGREHVIACLTNVAAETLEPGIYMQKGNYGLVISELRDNLSKTFNDQERILLVYEMLKTAGINIKISENIVNEQWAKLVWNASFNPMSVLYEATVGQLLEDPRKKQRILEIMLETIKVAKAQGIELDEQIAHNHIERTSAPDWYDFRTSMLQDFQNNKSIEIDELLGVVIERAEIHNTDVPEARKLYNELKEKL